MLPTLRIVDHRPELEDAERLVSCSHSNLPEEHGPPGVELDERRDDDEDRREQDEPERRLRDVERPLEESRRSREMRARKPDERHAFDRVQLCVRAEHLEHARDDVDLNVAVLHRPDHLQRLIVRVGREGDRDAVHTALAHEAGQIVGGSDQGSAAVPGSSDAIVAIDEPDDPQAVLGMLLDLVGEQMGDAARADDDDVLDVRRSADDRSRGSRRAGAG